MVTVRLEATGVVTDILLSSDSYTGDGVEGFGADDLLDHWSSFSGRFKRLVVARDVAFFRFMQLHIFFVVLTIL